MKKLGTRIMALALAAALVLSMGAFAAGDAGTQENADRLHALGLFLGLLFFIWIMVQLILWYLC